MPSSVKRSIKIIGQSGRVAMRATTGRFNLSSTARAGSIGASTIQVALQAVHLSVSKRSWERLFVRILGILGDAETKRPILPLHFMLKLPRRRARWLRSCPNAARRGRTTGSSRGRGTRDKTYEEFSGRIRMALAMSACGTPLTTMAATIPRVCAVGRCRLFPFQTRRLGGAGNCVR